MANLRRACTAAICQALLGLLGPDKVSLPGSGAYNASLTSYFALQVSDIHPHCFASPRAADEVAAVVELLTSNTTGRAGEVAIRSGGHMWVAGASNAPGGVTVDLRALDAIQLSADATTVSLGPGARWQDVYAALDPFGLSVAGGRIGTVGVGGLTLGGGISFFSPRRGWTCDTASAFQVVLANGSVVEANARENTDLFHGLRGGSNNLGIVTRIDLATFKQGDLWFANIYHPLTTVDEQIKTVARITAPENYDVDASFVTGFGYASTQGLTVVNNQLAYAKPAANGTNPAYYDAFLALPSFFNATAVLNMTSLARQGNSNLPPGAARYLFATTTFRPTEAMLRAAFDAWNSSLPGVAGIRGVTWSLSFEPLPPSLYAPGAAANALGLQGRAGTRVICLLSQAWADAADDAKVYAASAAVIREIEAAARRLGAYDPFLYLNYGAPWQDPIRSYGRESVRKLQALRARVDPGGVFTDLVRGGFKIPRG
ncbi:putative oxidoreductase [Podospora appendiculata]|uniref:Oxidoreductase n=1 Tax=Podospora appendiculata TaxID=314037 RepID=A0AAE0XAX9_9PEZI|nr:putative oxidoreductase [Podospora appendiculata]